jgi:cytochrome c551/c552
MMNSPTPSYSVSPLMRASEIKMPRKLVVPSAAEVAKKWADVTPARAPYYESETPKASSKWEADAAGAANIYKTAVQAANIGQMFAGGIKGKAAKFARKVKDVGVARYGPGISAAQGDMQAGVSAPLDELSKIEIPDRGPRGSPGNYAIVQKIGDPLHKRRLAELGASV